MTPGTIIAAGYPLIDSERQSLAKRIDAALAEAGGLDWRMKQALADAAIAKQGERT